MPAVRVFFLIISLLCTVTAVHAVLPQTQAQAAADSLPVRVQKFNPAALNAYKTKKEFQYRDEVLQEQRSLWQRFWSWVWEQLGRLIGAAGSNTLVRTAVLTALAALIVYVVVKLIGTDRLFAKRSGRSTMPYDVLNEDIHQIDYENEIGRLVGEGKYRLAVRLLYLRSLKRLTDASLISWEPAKTNSVYLNELTDPALNRPFRSLTKQFDYIWYGDFPIDSERFEPIRLSFDEFNRQVR
ncbi:DUF4129 domain-containing protein [Pedobacter yulinensis]|nr:DUF4129 domain-containing protein [Pedobacter yulinensis]